MNRISAVSSRVLMDIPCKVCEDHSSGKHYGIYACDGCAGFFKRSVRRSRQYICKSRGQGLCPVDKTHRNQCRACRLSKCIEAGMNKDAVQHERGPRNSTIRRQVAMFIKESVEWGGLVGSPPVTSHCFPPVSHLEPRLDTPTIHHIAAHSSVGFLSIPTKNSSHMMPGLSSSVETICEAAARLLFMCVQWVKTVPAFVALPHRDQVLLLEESWRELFVLAAAQFQMPLDARPLLTAAGVTTDQGSTDKVISMLSEIRALHETIAKFKVLQVDVAEYTCLKGILLFKTVFANNSSQVKSLSDLQTVTYLQDQAQLSLNHYIRTAYPTQPFRFGKLLLLLPSLRVISGLTIEEIFFRKTIGHIPIERLLVDMFKSRDL